MSSTVFSCNNMQLEVTQDTAMITQNVTPQAVHRNVKYINRLQNFNPGLTLIGLSGFGPGWMNYLLISFHEFGLSPPYHVDISRFSKFLFT